MSNNVQILVNPIEKKLAVRPCREEEKDSFSLVFLWKKSVRQNKSPVEFSLLK